MDPCQLDRPLRIASVLQICGLWCCSLNSVRWNATIQKSGELLHWFPALLREYEPVKKPLLDDINSGNKNDSKLEEDTLVTFSIEPIIAYLDDPDSNNPDENKDE